MSKNVVRDIGHITYRPNTDLPNDNNYTLGHIHIGNSVAHAFRRFPRQL